jgi:hypothetical protein
VLALSLHRLLADVRRERMIRQLIQVKDQKRARSTMQRAWYGLCKEEAEKRAQYRVMKNR